MEFTGRQTEIGVAAKIGGILFLLWAVLHIWVGFEGVHQYLSAGAMEQWNMLLGGVNAPRETFQYTTDVMTNHAQSQLIVNFCIDVGGYGVLGLVVAWMIWVQASWLGYFIGLVIIGICDLAFTFSLLTSGIIEMNAGSVGGPVIWLLAIVITPFGLPALKGKYK